LTRFALLLCVVVAGLGLFSPNDFYLSFASRIAIYGLYAMSLAILLGQAGLMSFGHTAFFGLAAYCVGWLSTTGGLNPWLSAAAALASGIAVSLVFGAFAVRVTETAFVMITLAFGQVAWGLAYRWVSVTGGDNGITGIARPGIGSIELTRPLQFLVFCALVLLLAVFAIDRLRDSALGASIRGVRDQPRRMSALGYNVWAIRLAAFGCAGFLASIAGVLDCWQQRFVSPVSLSLLDATMVLLMVVIGGASSRFGPLVGTVVVMCFNQFADQFVSRTQAALGVVLILIVIFMPSGIAPWFESRFRTRKAEVRHDLSKVGEAK
jgi:branched-chain amino acid transport system permease protein